MIRYTQRLAEAGAVASVGSRGDSYDNALAEAFNSLFTAEPIRNRGPWTGIDEREFAVAEYIDWFNHRRLHGQIGHIPPIEFETAHHTADHTPVAAGERVTASLQQTRGLTPALNRSAVVRRRNEPARHAGLRRRAVSLRRALSR